MHTSHSQEPAIRSGTLLAPQLDYILLDGSGSMLPKWPETIASLETYLKALRASNLNSHLTLSVISSRTTPSFVQRDTLLRDAAPLTISPLESEWGRTPLYDAINIMGRSLRNLKPPRASILIITDGDENASQYTDLTQAKAILDYLRALGYQITFFGCDFNNSAQARALGSSEATAIGVSRTLLSDATSLLAKKRTNYGLYGTEINFTTDEQTQFGGLLGFAPGEAGPLTDAAKGGA